MSQLHPLCLPNFVQLLICYSLDLIVQEIAIKRFLAIFWGLVNILIVLQAVRHTIIVSGSREFHEGNAVCQSCQAVKVKDWTPSNPAIQGPRSRQGPNGLCLEIFFSAKLWFVS